MLFAMLDGIVRKGVSEVDIEKVGGSLPALCRYADKDSVGIIAETALTVS